MNNLMKFISVFFLLTVISLISQAQAQNTIKDMIMQGVFRETELVVMPLDFQCLAIQAKAREAAATEINGKSDQTKKNELKRGKTFRRHKRKYRHGAPSASKRDLRKLRKFNRWRR